MADFYSGKATQPKTDYLFDAIGNTNLTFINKFGYNGDIDSSTDPEDVWSFGGLYTFISSPVPLFISSSNNADNQEITVSGLDENWLPQTQVVTLTGQTKAPIPGTWLRVHRALNSDSTSFAGRIYIYEDTTPVVGVPTASFVRAVIETNAQQTQMALYTIPANKTGYISSIIANVYNAGNADSSALMQMLIRKEGGVFRDIFRFALNSTGSSTNTYEYQFPVKFPPKTDIIFRVLEVNKNDTAISINFQIVEDSNP